MREITITIGENGTTSASSEFLGRVGENLSSRILFDVSEWDTGLTNAHYALNFEQPYGISMTVFAGRTANNGIISYEVESIILKDGVIKLQLEASNGQEVCLSDKQEMWVGSSVSPNQANSGDFPTWYDNMISSANTLSDEIGNANSTLSTLNELLSVSSNGDYYVLQSPPVSELNGLS